MPSESPPEPLTRPSDPVDLVVAAHGVESPGEATAGAGTTRAPMNMAGAVARGVLWTAVAKFGSQLVTWGSTIYVARVLTPADYGIVAMAVVFTDLVAYVCELGIGQSLLVYRDLTPSQVRQLNTLAAALGVVGAVVIAGLALLAPAALFGNPELRTVLLALSPMFVASSFRTVPASMLQRELKFGRLAVYDAAQAFILAATSLALALAGAGYWTLVVSILAANVLSAVGVVYARPVGFARPRLADIRPALALSRNVMAGRLMWYVYARADSYIIGRVLGSVALGSYSLAWTIANAPVDKAGTVIAQVVPGVFSAASTEPRKLGDYFLRFTEVVTLLFAPASIGLALTASDFVHAVLGARWAPMVAPLTLLAVFSVVRAIKPLIGQALVTSGQSGRDALYNFVLLLTFPAAIWLAAPQGLTWVAAMWLVVFPPLLAWQIGMALRALGRSWGEYLRALFPAAQACAVVAAAVLLAKFATPHTVGARGRLAAAASAGAVAYGLYVFVVHGERLREFRRQTRRAG